MTVQYACKTCGQNTTDGTRTPSTGVAGSSCGVNDEQGRRRTTSGCATEVLSSDSREMSACRLTAWSRILTAVKHTAAGSAPREDSR